MLLYMVRFQVTFTKCGVAALVTLEIEMYLAMIHNGFCLRGNGCGGQMVCFFMTLQDMDIWSVEVTLLIGVEFAFGRVHWHRSDLRGG